MNAPKSVEYGTLIARLYEWAVYAEREIHARAGPWSIHADLRRAASAILALSGPVSGMDTSSVAGVHCEQAGSHTGGLTPLDKELIEALRPFAEAAAHLGRVPDQTWIDLNWRNVGVLEKPMTVEDFRRASAAIAKAEATATEAQQHPAGDTIEINGRTYRRFIPHPQVVDDGTVRCIFCGQIDDDPWHDMKLCLDRPAPEMAKRPSPPPAAPPSPAPPSSEREGSRAGDRS
jgi:hypothetical protein